MNNPIKNFERIVDRSGEHEKFCWKKGYTFRGRLAYINKEETFIEEVDDKDEYVRLHDMKSLKEIEP